MSAAPRILHLTRDFPPRCGGGISTAVGGLVATAREAGLPHAVLSFDAWRPTRASGAAPLLDGDRDRGVLLRLGGPADLHAAREAVTRFQPDALHVHHALLFAVAAELSPRTPRLFTAHVLQRHLSSLRGLSAPTLSDAAEASAVRDAARVSVPTHAARALLGAPSAFVTRLATRKPDRVSDPNTSAPTRTDITSENIDDSPRLLVLSRFDTLKGTGDVLAALPSLLALRDDLSVTVAGGIPENPKSDRRWRRRFEATGLPAHRFRLLPWQSPEEVDARLSRATHFVAPSHAETCGLALLEARAAGLTLVASDLPAHREVAPDATYFQPGDVEGLVRAVRVSLDRPAPATDSLARPSSPSWAEVLPDWVHFWRIWG